MLEQSCTIKSPLPALSTCVWWLMSHAEGLLGTLLTPGAGWFLREGFERVRGWVWLSESQPCCFRGEAATERLCIRMCACA